MKKATIVSFLLKQMDYQYQNMISLLSRPTSQSAHYGVDTYQYSHKNDALAGDGSIRGAKQMNNVITDSKSRSSLFYHSKINNPRRRSNKRLGNTYQFYIWKSKK